MTKIAARALLLVLALGLFAAQIAPVRAYAAQTSQQKNAAKSMKAYQKQRKRQAKKIKKQQRKAQKNLQKLHNTSH